MIKPYDPDEAKEYDALLREVCERADSTGDRVNLMEQLIWDAQNAQRQWAHDVARQATRAGYAEEIKNWLKRHTVVVVTPDERKVRKPRFIGVKRMSRATNELVDMQFDMFVATFDELKAKRQEALRQIRAYGDNVATFDRLIALADLAPEADTPADAARILGIDLEDYLGHAA